MRRSPPHTKDCRSGVCCSRMTCLGPGREGREITSGRRDARGLTFSVVIPTRVMQPGVSTRGKQNGRISSCGYGMTFALRRRVHLLCVASLAHLRCAHRLGCSLAGLCWRARVGLAPGPPLNHKLRLLAEGGGWLECLFPYLQKPRQRNAFDAHPPAPLEAAAPAVLCAGRMDLRTAVSTRHPEPCSGHPCEPTR
ncbi:protein of unknown function [Cyanobium sp. NIES-981]|nr:protein of unknown function [Cyanobium sp. NIES-981]